MRPFKCTFGDVSRTTRPLPGALGCVVCSTRPLPDTFAYVGRSTRPPHYLRFARSTRPEHSPIGSRHGPVVHEEGGEDED